MDEFTDLDWFKIFRAQQENTRQNIGCLMAVLNMGQRAGTEYQPQFDHTLDDDIIRRQLLEQLSELAKKLL